LQVLKKFRWQSPAGKEIDYAAQLQVSGLEAFYGGKTGFNSFIKLGFLFEFRRGDRGLFSFLSSV
jgi:hypothetical protein